VLSFLNEKARIRNIATKQTSKWLADIDAWEQAEGREGVCKKAILGLLLWCVSFAALLMCWFK
jgi:hypothetical protein